jgi:glycosyltransferase involved in cell wall biosynthesis
MTVVILLEERYYRTPDGSVWTLGAHAYRFWCRYLGDFDRVRVVARVLDVPELTGNAQRADGPRVDIAAVPYYVGPAQFMRHSWAIRRAIRRAIGPKDAVILRVPSTLANCLEAELRTSNRPFGLEVIADPYDVFAPRAVKHSMRQFFRWWFARVLRRQCKNAAGVAYVTEHTLQRRYPSSRYSVGMSDVELHENALVGAPPAFATYYSSVEISDEDTVHSARTGSQSQGLLKLVTVGSLEQPYKGVDVLIRAIGICALAKLPLSLTIVGAGRYRASLEHLAKTLEIGDKVSFTGQLNSPEAVRSVLDDSDIFVLASRTEGLPRAMIEAMARALPCIGTAVGGIPELLQPCDLVPPDNPGALAAKIREIAIDTGRRAQMSKDNLTKANGYRVNILEKRRRQFFQHIRTCTEAWIASPGILVGR